MNKTLYGVFGQSNISNNRISTVIDSIKPILGNFHLIQMDMSKQNIFQSQQQKYFTYKTNNELIKSTKYKMSEKN